MCCLLKALSDAQGKTVDNGQGIIVIGHLKPFDV